MTLTKDFLIQEYSTNGKSFVKIAKELNICSNTVAYWIKKHGIKARPRSQNLKTMVGMVFGKLTVIKKVFNNRDTHAKWLCKCECGNFTEVVRPSLVNNLTTSCGCRKFNANWKGYGRLSSVYWGRIKKGAASRNLDFEISIKDAWELFIKQNERCALSNIKIEIVTNYTHKWKLHTASLDRIDNSKGYIKGNIQWVHRKINIMRGKMDVDRFITFCKMVAEHAGIKKING